MKRIVTGLIVATFAAAALPALMSPAAYAETVQTKESLLTKVQQEQDMNLPKRGMTMDQVKKEYGEPLKILPTRGGSSKFQPPIHRWEYQKYIVYFEYSHVVHSVARTPGVDAL